ncbi:uncharacterized protein [Prorops nasuta]|uniref:uncharacterized protein n=1 Tax=Prorops nasuta TaxID=863751 RepID=UPI0034CE9269
MTWFQRLTVIFLIIGVVRCNSDDDNQDVSSVFMEAAQSFFQNKDALNNLQGVASFVQSDAGKQVGDILTNGRTGDSGVGQIISGISSLLSDGQNQEGGGTAFNLLNSVLENLASPGNQNRQKRSQNRPDTSNEQGIDLQNIINVGKMFFGQHGNTDLVMGLVPMLLENLGYGDSDGANKHDHSGHSWFLPPVIENVHVMWDHFSNSELGKTLWKNSGIQNIIVQMSDNEGNIQYERIIDSFENPTLRRRWVKSLTNFVAEWLSHVSDPAIQQRYLATAQFVGNSFLKSQGFPKSVMFDQNRPAESISRLVNSIGKRYLGVKVDSVQYIKPAIAYIQELTSLASEKGFIMSRINARELSNKLSDTINNDLIAPLLKAYRVYKWAVKMPHCASQILCTINEKHEDDDNSTNTRKLLTKFASFPAAWAISNKSGINFWSLYGAVLEQEGCMRKYPADCTVFHEEEIRVTTEYSHSEL